MPLILHSVPRASILAVHFRIYTFPYDIESATRIPDRVRQRAAHSTTARKLARGIYIAE
jgi:hypothetical protein